MSKRDEIVGYAKDCGMEAAAELYGIKLSTVERYCRKDKRLEEPNVVLAIPDCHCPFMRKQAVKFLKDVYEEHGCNKVVHLGDMADFHSVSRHQSSANADGAVLEYNKMLEQVQEITEAFPNVQMCTGNHDSIPVRQAATLGIPRLFIKDIRELLKLPDGWTVQTSVKIDGVKYYHGINAGGVSGAYNSAIKNMQSIVVGHSHTQGGVKYFSNADRLIFGAASGCLIDPSTYAFEYAKEWVIRPILGATVVYNSEKAVFIPMDMRRYS